MNGRSRARRFRILTVLLLLPYLSATACAQERWITVLHTNDMHATFQPREATWVRETPRPMIGGFPRLQSLIDSIRNVESPVLLLDAGDVMTGNPIADRVYRGAEGGALFEMMNMMGYDAWAPGNHDLDISQENLIGLTRIARFPTLCANLVNDSGEFPVGNKPYAVIERGGLRIGIIGLMSQQLYGLVNQGNLKGLRVLSLEETLRKYAREIDGRTDLLIALTHQGAVEDSLLALKVPEVDIIVGGALPHAARQTVECKRRADCPGGIEHREPRVRQDRCAGRQDHPLRGEADTHMVQGGYPPDETHGPGGFNAGFHRHRVR